MTFRFRSRFRISSDFSRTTRLVPPTWRRRGGVTVSSAPIAKRRERRFASPADPSGRAVVTPDVSGSLLRQTAARNLFCGFIQGAVAVGAPIITDDWSGYASLAKRGYKHLAVAERGDPQVVEEYLPIIHLVFSNLKTWLSGIHHGVSDQHLQALPQRVHLPVQQAIYPFNAFRSLLGIAGDVKAPTYAELGHPKCSGCG